MHMKTDLKDEAKYCESAKLHDTLVRDRIASGLTIDQVKGRLLKEGDQTLEKRSWYLQC